MEAQPLRSISGNGRCSVEMSSENKEYWTVKMESPVEESEPSVKLGLGIGDHCSARNPVSSSSISISNQSRKLESEFTRAQLGELYHQSLIYKYLAAGLPVPLQLVLPFCNGGYYEPYSGCLRVAAFDDRSMMDPEPSRCRRTDGKKWRCRKTVVPNQKYCEGHMHRGRQRSRKPVEISKNFPTEMASRISVADWGNSKGNNCIPSALPLMMSPASNSCSSNRGINANDTTMTNNHVNGKHKTEATVTCAIGSVSSNKRAMVSNATDTTITNNYSSGKNNTEATVTSAVVTASTTLNSTMNGGRASDSVSDSGKINGSIAVEEKQKIHRSSISKSGNLRSGPIVTLGCSPKSVLQAAAGCGSGSSSNLFIHKTEVGLEPWRCRRTDGKRWRCSRDVLPDQKYCARHINRGVRKQPEMVVTSSNPINLNTNLSISITADIQNERKSSTSRSSSGSDTTLTDSAVAPHEYHSNASS